MGIEEGGIYQRRNFRLRRERANGSGWVNAILSTATPSLEGTSTCRTFEGNVSTGAEACAFDPKRVCRVGEGGLRNLSASAGREKERGGFALHIEEYYAIQSSKITAISMMDTEAGGRRKETHQMLTCQRTVMLPRT